MHSRILLLTEHFPPHVGGVPRWLYNVYSRLEDYFVTILTGADNVIRCPHLEVISIHWPLRSWTLLSYGNWLAYSRLLYFTSQVYYHTHSSVIHAGRCIPEGFVCWMLNRIFGIPYLCYVHGEDIEIAWRCREYYHLVRPTLRQAALLVANSRFTRDLLVNKWQVPSRRVRILHPGVDTHYFCPSHHRCERLMLTIACPGRFQRRKGQDMLLRALALVRKEIPNIGCILAGNGDDAHYLRKLANELALDGSIRWISYPTDDQLLQLYRESDLVALPNREIDGDCEGFGIVLLEAQACSKPILCGNSGGTKETLVPGRSGLVVDCTDPVNIAKAIIRFYKDKTRLAGMATFARRWVERYFDWNVLIPKARVILRSLFKDYDH
jgi:phosphatidylinositol alpha-1,6-mannosyltransferase